MKASSAWRTVQKDAGAKKEETLCRCKWDSGGTAREMTGSSCRTSNRFPASPVSSGRYTTRCRGRSGRRTRLPSSRSSCCPENVDIPRNGEPQAYKCQGLWDTGASCSVISKRLVSELGLPAISKVPIIGVNGKFITTSHVIDLWLPNKYVVRRVNVTMGTLSPNFDVLYSKYLKNAKENFIKISRKFQ